MMWVFDLKQTGDLHRVQGIKIEWQFHSILVRRKMPFEIRLPGQEKLFRADSNPSTQLSSGAINCMLNMNWHCYLKRLDFSISRIYSYDLLRDEGDYQLEAWKPKQGSAASDSEQCMGKHGYKVNLAKHISCLSQAVIKAQQVFFFFGKYYSLLFQHQLVPYWFAMKNAFCVCVCFLNDTMHIIFGLWS